MEGEYVGPYFYGKKALQGLVPKVDVANQFRPPLAKILLNSSPRLVD